MACPPASRDDFPVAIICALKAEYDAVSLLVEFWDEDGDGYGTAPGDDNTYKTGRIGNVDIVLVHLPDKGNVAAAIAASNLRSSFPKLKLVFLTGVCGGVPTTATDQEMVLGDVIISKSIIQYYSRQYHGSFEMRERLLEPVKSVQSLLVTLEADHWRKRLKDQAAGFLKHLQANASSKGQQAKYMYPGTANDRLFEYDYRHKHQLSMTHVCAECHESSGSTCYKSRELSCEELGCSDGHVVRRDRLELKRSLEEYGLTDEAQAPDVFFGRFASGDMVIKSGEQRDKIAKQHGIRAFEMEGAGVWEQVPCIIVKGVCDYADSHKNKTWQTFAAATAASMVRALVEHLSPSMRAGAPDRPGRLAHRAGAVTNLTYLPQYQEEQVLCYRCDRDTHKLRRCYALEKTVWEGRANRKDQGRCMNCGASDHWWKECDWENLLKRRK